MNSPVDAIAEIISYLNQRDFAGARAVCGPTYPLYPRHDHVSAHYLHFILESHFQPIVNIAHEQVVAHEAFLRIPSPAGVAAIGNALAPETLFAGADDDEITYLDRLTRTLHALNFLLQNTTQEPIGALHLNVHPQHLLAVDGDHGKTFEGILQQCGLAPSRIVLELAEHRIAEKNRLSDAIRAWQSRGYRIAIDNFGRDQTPEQDALALRLRPDLIKIDQTSLHASIEQTTRLRTLGESVARAQDSGIQTVVVGVETPAHLLAVRQIGAQYAQGYYYGKPAPHCVIADFGDMRWEN